MIHDFLYLLLKVSMTASLSNRETFIEKVAYIIEKKMHKDPQSARHLSDQITGIMEGLNGTLILQQLFGSKQDRKLNKNLEELTTAIKKLNTLLEEAGLPDTPLKS